MLRLRQLNNNYNQAATVATTTATTKTTTTTMEWASCGLWLRNAVVSVLQFLWLYYLRGWG